MNAALLFVTSSAHGGDDGLPLASTRTLIPQPAIWADEASTQFTTVWVSTMIFFTLATLWE